MPGAASERSSSDLRQEMAALDVRLSELDGKSSDQDAKIRALALAVVRNDPTAPGRVASCRKLKAEIADEILLVRQAKESLDVEIAEAVEREAAAARKAISDEALAFAGEVEPIGAVIDEALGKFQETLQDLKRRLSQAERRGYGPSAMIVQSSLTQSLRAALWRISE